jgi:tetratricopeptide (TPR) repeat protein
MLRKIAICFAFLLAFVLTAVPAARAQARVDGEIRGMDGNVVPDATITLKGTESGQTYTLKTDKKGKFVQIGVTAGTYDMSIIINGQTAFTGKIAIKNGEDNTQNINLKELAAQQAAAHPEEEKKKEETEDKMKDLKIQFAAGKDALTEADSLRKQIPTAPADQKAAMQDKMNADIQTGLTAFQKAETDVTEKDPTNHATVLSYLGQAYRMSGQYDKAIDAYQKSIGFKPSATVYNQLSLSQISGGAVATDPAKVKASVGEASDSCDKAIALDPTMAAMCWKNIGAVLINNHHQPEAVDALQKASAADPKDAQTWFLLGGALTSTMTYKTEGDKEIMVITPGTQEAYQKCIDVAPSGPYAPQCKQSLTELAALTGGVETNVGGKKKKGQ